MQELDNRRAYSAAAERRNVIAPDFNPREAFPVIHASRGATAFDSRFEQLEPRQMLDAAGGGTGSQPPEIEFSYLGLPTEVAELAAPFFDNGSEFSESSLSFPTEQIVDNGDSPPVQNIFQVTATPWNNQRIMKGVNHELAIPCT